jgi:hypothetical protein
MPKGNWKAYGQILMGIEKPMGNAQIQNTPQPIGEEAALPSCYQQNVAISIIFSEALHFCL